MNVARVLPEGMDVNDQTSKWLKVDVFPHWELCSDGWNIEMGFWGKSGHIPQHTRIWKESGENISKLKQDWITDGNIEK